MGIINKYYCALHYTLIGRFTLLESSSNDQYPSPGLFHQSYALSVGLQPVLETTGRVFYVSPGEKVVLPCVVRNKGSLVRLWKQGPRLMFADEMRVRRDSRYSVSQAGELLIAGFELSDRGQYQCELETDTHTPVTLQHRLEAAEAPAVVRLPESGQVELAETENTTLQCVATGKPRPRVTWTRPGQTGQILRLVGVTRHQAGNISCTADNGVGQSVTATFSLTVACRSSLSVPSSPPSLPLYHCSPSRGAAWQHHSLHRAGTPVCPLLLGVRLAQG